MQSSTVIATVGVSLLLFAFFSNLFGFQKQNSWGYLVLNLTGAALACYASSLIDFLPFVILEGTWATVAAFAIGKKIF